MQDSVTGLLNSQGFTAKGIAAIENAALQDKKMALHIIHICNLKDIVMEEGLPVGEAVLKGITGRLYGMLRPSKVLARLEGENIGVLQREVESRGHVLYVARRILESLIEPFEVMGHNIAVQANIGTAFFPDHGEDWQTLYHDALLALESARSQQAGVHRVYQE